MLKLSTYRGDGNTALSVSIRYAPSELDGPSNQSAWGLSLLI